MHGWREVPLRGSICDGNAYICNWHCVIDSKTVEQCNIIMCVIGFCIFCIECTDMVQIDKLIHTTLSEIQYC